MSQYIIYNGVLKKTDEYNLTAENRAFLYGDSFFETIFGNYDKIPFLPFHHKRILKAINTFGFIASSEIEVLQQLKKMIIFLAHKNKIYNSYRIRIVFFRKIGGLYLPLNNQMDYLIQVFKLEKDPFKSSLNNISLGLYRDITKDFSLVSGFKTNSLLNVFASIYSHKIQVDDVIILNSKGNIVETTNSNIFFIIDDQVITPPLSSGCVEGITRHIIINDLLPKLKLSIVEQNINLEILEQASEIFVSNSINFVKSIREFSEKRYLNFTVNRIYSQFLKIVEEKLI